MLNLAARSIKFRLTLLLVIAGGCTFLASYLAFLTYERSALRASMVRNLRTQALVLSQAIAADLDFGGLLNSSKSMAFLATNKHILAAKVFDAEGHPFTSMVAPRNRTALPDQPSLEDSARFRAEELDLFIRIYQEGEFKGTLFLRSDVQEISIQFRHTVKILAFACPALLLVLLAVSALLQRQLSTPLLELAEATKRIAQDQDFGLRLRRSQGGEIGALTDAFNEMLGHLQERDERIQEDQEHLEDQILQRSEQLLQTKQLLSATLDALPVYIAILDQDGRILSTNHKWEQFAESGNPLIFEVKAGQIYQGMEHLFRSDPNQDRQDYSFEGRDGRRWFTLQASRFVTAATHHTVLMHLDVTEQRLLESQLRQAQKLESIGQLAAGIAHEINTPTQYIGDNSIFLRSAFADLETLLKPLLVVLAQAQTGPADPAQLAVASQALAKADLPFLQEEVPKAIQQCLEGVQRVSRIVSAMKDFSHPGTTKTATDLNRAIESTTLVCRGEWKYVANLELNLDPGLPATPCLPDEFNQVILNLVINAAHAIAETQRPEKGLIRIATQVEDGWAVIRVSDTGAGIPEAIRGKIFDPFFTTKPVGKGTGQGLAITYATIVNKHAGTITVDSQVGQGSTFTLRLPLSDPDSNAPGEHPAPPMTE